PEQLQCRTVCGQGAVRCVRFNADGNYCLTGGADKSLKLWNPAKSLLLRSYLGHGQEVLAVACACDNANLASGGEDKMVAYWDTASGTAVRKYRSHLARVGALAFSPDATLLASGSVDCTVRLWDLRSKAQAPVQLLTDARDSVTAVAVHSWRIYTASLDGRLRCYDARKGAVAEGLWFESFFYVSFRVHVEGPLFISASVRIVSRLGRMALSAACGRCAEGSHCLRELGLSSNQA
ncbi:hypothetical protein BOX15_Mlig010980g1, partial [Macrostomum lignano]